MAAQGLPLGWLIHSADLRLRERSGAEARLEAELLLAHVLGSTRSQLYAELARFATPDEREQFNAMIERRLQGEPVAYITGHREFFGLELEVNRDVLIPRPETEQLVEVTLEALMAPEERPFSVLRPPAGNRRSTANSDLRVADVGTGSGAIAIALAAHLPTARIYATDVSAAALTVAHRNVQLHGVADRIVLLEGDLLSSLPEPVDAIVANLPYVPSEELEALQREVSEHEPRLALDGGPDGLDMYRRLLPQVLQYLRSSGFLVLEIGAGQGDLIEAIAAGYLPGSKIEIRPDFAGISRVVKIEVADGR